MAEQTRGPTLRRWVQTLAVAALVAAVCAAAGLWQWSRHTDRSAAIAQVEAGYNAAPVPVAELLRLDTELPQESLWRPATVVGHYLQDAEVLLRNRPVSGQPGFHVLTPLVIEEGELAGAVLVVDRGWVPTGGDGSGDVELPPAPRGTTEVVVRLRPGEPPSARQAPAGQVQAIAVDQVREASRAAWPDRVIADAYGAVATEDGVPPTGLGALPRPSTDPGSHLSYAFQWFVFAVGAVVGSIVLMRRDTAARDGDDRDAAAQPRPARRRAPTAEEEEDALLDAQQVP